MITVSDLELRAGSRLLVENVAFQVAAGDKIGLVGRNGAGKTTLLKVLAGEGAARGREGHQQRDDRLPAAGHQERRPRCARHRPDPAGPRPRRGAGGDAAGRARHGRHQPGQARRRGPQVRPAGGAADRARRLRGRGRGSVAGLQPRAAPEGAEAAAAHPVRRSAPPGRAGQDPVRRRVHAAARRADQPPGRRLGDLAPRSPAQLPRRPDRGQPRHRPARGAGDQGASTWTPTARCSTSTTSAGRPTWSSARPTRAGAAGNGPTPSGRRPRSSLRPTRCGPRRPRPGPRRAWPGGRRDCSPASAPTGSLSASRG